MVSVGRVLEAEGMKVQLSSRVFALSLVELKAMTYSSREKSRRVLYAYLRRREKTANRKASDNYV